MSGHIRGYVNGVIDGEFTGVIDGEMGAVVRARDSVERVDRNGRTMEGDVPGIEVSDLENEASAPREVSGGEGEDFVREEILAEEDGVCIRREASGRERVFAGSEEVSENDKM